MNIIQLLSSNCLNAMKAYLQASAIKSNTMVKRQRCYQIAKHLATFSRVGEIFDDLGYKMLVREISGFMILRLIFQKLARNVQNGCEKWSEFSRKRPI